MTDINLEIVKGIQVSGKATTHNTPTNITPNVTGGNTDRNSTTMFFCIMENDKKDSHVSCGTDEVYDK